MASAVACCAECQWPARRPNSSKERVSLLCCMQPGRSSMSKVCAAAPAVLMCRHALCCLLRTVHVACRVHYSMPKEAFVVVPKFLNRLLALKLLEQKVSHAKALPAAHRMQPCCSACSVAASPLCSSLSGSGLYRHLFWGCRPRCCLPFCFLLCLLIAAVSATGSC